MLITSQSRSHLIIKKELEEEPKSDSQDFMRDFYQKFTLEKIEQALSILRGTSAADLNCPQLAAGMIGFLTHGPLPTEPAVERATSLKDFTSSVEYGAIPGQNQTIPRKPQRLAHVIGSTLREAGVFEEVMPGCSLQEPVEDAQGSIMYREVIDFIKMPLWRVAFKALEKVLQKKAEKHPL